MAAKRHGIRLSIKDAKTLAKKRGGKCLSKKYINVHKKLKWQCQKGHIWEALYHNIQRSKWCPHCSRNAKLSIHDAKAWAKKKNGKCLSTVYSNNSTNLVWNCKEGHNWESSFANIKQGKWCPICSGNTPLSLYALRETAKKRHGKCLSKKYINSMSKYLWQCELGHRWHAVAGSVRAGSWCPRCAGVNKQSEQLCRHAFETIFDGDFPTVYPSWLMNDDGNPMHLDGYNKKLKIAFEYQGPQHYSPSSYYSSEELLRKRKRDDRTKVRSCKKRGVKLIIINHKDKGKNLTTFTHNILANIRKQRLVILKDFLENPKVNYENAIIPHSQIKLREARATAKKEGGSCLSKNYYGANEKLMWKCTDGHIWNACLGVIRAGHWCPQCAGLAPLNIKLMRLEAQKHGGKCLSGKYVNNSTKLKWECKNRHIFKALPSNIRRGKWCGQCYGNIALTIQDMWNLAQKKCGKCISRKYSNSKEKLKWKCKKGHIWRASSAGIRRGTWCPQCSGNLRLSIKHAQELARKRDGKCLSKSYINNRTKLKWKCEKEHIWEARLGSIKRGSWCPHCARWKRSEVYRLNHFSQT